MPDWDAERHAAQVDREGVNRAAANIIIFVARRNQRLIQEMLYAGHYNSVISVSGKDAADMIQSGTCDVLIADADHDGEDETMTAIEAARRAGVEPLLLAEHMNAGDEKLYRAAGVQVILQQPVSMGALFSAIERFRAAHH